MRLFIALPLPGPVKEQLVDMKQPIDGVRWEQKSKLHLTLKFLGDTNYDRARQLQEKLNAIECPSFAISLKGFGYFPKGNQPKVLWTGVKKSQLLTRLQQTIEDECTAMGFDPESRSFKPHITIARTNSASKRDVMSFINQHKKFQITDVPVEEFVLYESKLDANGAKHSRIKTFSLADRE